MVSGYSKKKKCEGDIDMSEVWETQDYWSQALNPDDQRGQVRGSARKDEVRGKRVEESSLGEKRGTMDSMTLFDLVTCGSEGRNPGL